MKALALLALAGLTPFVFAAEQNETSAGKDVPVELYTYGMKLDVAHVIETTDVSTVCGIAPLIMTYEDHQGLIHRLQYRVLGGGCVDG